MTGHGRALRLTWKDVRGPGWTKRARLYLGQHDCRVEYIDTTHRLNEFYKNYDEAKAAVDEFADGKTALQMRKKED